MNIVYSTMRYDNQQLIVKTVGKREPFVIATCYAPEIAEEICRLLNREAEKGESA